MRHSEGVIRNRLCQQIERLTVSFFYFPMIIASRVDLLLITLRWAIALHNNLINLLRDVIKSYDSYLAWQREKPWINWSSDCIARCITQSLHWKEINFTREIKLVDRTHIAHNAFLCWRQKQINIHKKIFYNETLLMTIISINTIIYKHSTVLFWNLKLVAAVWTVNRTATKVLFIKTWN